MTAPASDRTDTAWYTLSAPEVVRVLGSEASHGLTQAAATRELERHGPNALPQPVRASAWQIVMRIWADPMNAMLTVVAAVAFVAGQQETGLLVAVLVALNLFMGAGQELKARESVDALDSLQVPQAMVVRDGHARPVPATDLVPGDVILLEPGDLVPADGRIIESASLEVVESGLTGESAPVDKGPAPVPSADTALGDRTSMVFQNTMVTRGTARVVVCATGSSTEMGKIAGMLNSVTPEPSPLQRELRSLTIKLSILAWVAVAIIVGISMLRGLPSSQIVLLAITVAISSIPSGLPTFLTAMLSFGAQRLAAAKAIVRNLTDVETLGCTSAINSDKTGTLTLDMMTATRMFSNGQWFRIEGNGYSTSGAILATAGQETPDFTPLALGLTLCSDAVVNDDATVTGDPTEAALVVLAAKMGVDAGISRREYPRVALVPFDSEYKFMATFHEATLEGEPLVVELVKGAPDVLLQRCSHAFWGEDEMPIAEVLSRFHQANDELASDGLRVMSFAYRTFPAGQLPQVQADPMAAVNDLVFVALVGIIDPLRPSAKDAVAIARHAGIDVRMITGDHAVTAAAIAADLGLAPGVITGPEFQRLTDAELKARVDELHVFGRVSPEDKLRLVAVLQEEGEIVAMTGDAVNDAAALKKADIGVAMGSGSDVTKQAANLVLTDDNFATLVHAIELGRDVYSKIVSQLRYVMIGLFGVLLSMLLASAFDINDGQALTPVMLIFMTFLIGLFPALGISTDSTEPGTMDKPPRDPRLTILNRQTGTRWFLFGLLQALCILSPYLLLGARDGSGVTGTGQTTAFLAGCLSTVFIAAAVRRDLIPAWEPPYVLFYLWLLVPLMLTWLAVQSELLNPVLGTVPLSGGQWLLAAGLALVVFVVIELDKAVRRRRDRA
jgi:Ca2+-transporting ATPase